MSRAKWESVVEPKAGRNAPPGVRRFAVPGGWLYQTEHYVELTDAGDIAWVEWFAPVFVPFHGDGHSQAVRS